MSDEKRPVCEVLKSPTVHDRMDVRGQHLTTRNLAELERDMVALERMVIPMLNQVRGMLGKRPVIVPKE